jgi:hypothetical protein
MCVCEVLAYKFTLTHTLTHFLSFTYTHTFSLSPTQMQELLDRRVEIVPAHLDSEEAWHEVSHGPAPCVPLAECAAQNNAETMQLLMDHKADIDYAQETNR